MTSQRKLDLQRRQLEIKDEIIWHTRNELELMVDLSKERNKEVLKYIASKIANEQGAIKEKEYMLRAIEMKLKENK